MTEQMFYHWRDGVMIEVVTMTGTKANERRRHGWDLRPVMERETTEPGTIILITGSRVWEDKNAILRALCEVLATCEWPVTIMTGGHKRWSEKHQRYISADYLAGEIAREVGIDLDENPVTPEEWERIGRSAGPKRNRTMVEKIIASRRKAVCIGFPWGESRGTRGCMDMAAEAGIHVIDKGKEK